MKLNLDYDSGVNESEYRYQQQLKSQSTDEKSGAVNYSNEKKILQRIEDLLTAIMEKKTDMQFDTFFNHLNDEHESYYNYGLGLFYLKQNDKKRSLKHFSFSYEQFKAIDKYVSASIACSKSIEQNPKNGELHRRIAEMHHKYGAKKEALDSYLEAIEIYKEKRDWSKVKNLCNIAESIDPNNPLISEMYGYAYQNTAGKKAEAINYYEKAKQIYLKCGQKKESERCNKTIDEMMSSSQVQELDIPYFTSYKRDNINTVAISDGIPVDEWINSNHTSSNVLKLAESDDMLLDYDIYKVDRSICLTLERTNGSYKQSYSKLENFFLNLFFEMLSLRQESFNDSNKDFKHDEYCTVKSEFLEFKRIINQALGQAYMDQNSSSIGTIYTTPALSLLKKLLKSIDPDLNEVQLEYIEQAKHIAVPGSALFFLELFTQLKRKDIILKLQRYTNDYGYDEISGLIDIPLLLLKPWDHQFEAFKAWKNNRSTGIVEMATATGKTVVGFMAIEHLVNTNQTNRKIIVRIIASSTAILNQWRRELIEKMGLMADPKLDYNSSIICKGAHIYFQTVHIVMKRPESYGCDLLIVDEVHHFAAESFRNALKVPTPRKMGLSATIEGKTKLDYLVKYLGPIIYRFDLESAIRADILPKFEWKLNVVYLSVTEEEEFEQISKKILLLFNHVSTDYATIRKISKSEVTITNLYHFVRLTEIARYKKIGLPDEWKALQAKLQERRWIIHRSQPKINKAIELASYYLELKKKIILFVMDINTCDLVASELEKKYSNVYVAHSKMKDANRSILEFKRSASGILIGAKMLDEGIDIPDAEIGINVSSTESKLQLVQRLGRVLRKKDNKNPIFHHFIGLPSTGSYVNYEDNIKFMEELSNIQDIALHLGVETEMNYETDQLLDVHNSAETMVHENNFGEKVGTLYLGNILKQFNEKVVHETILRRLELLDPNKKISDEKWRQIVREAFGIKDELYLNVPGYWWILVIGDRNAKKISQLLKSKC
ncbi:DEAD/DEAH box helicase family protein [Methanosalsum natronophilum]|uniref:DEAD/DEAH box helicase family protein n=1 Tax=Methanosalsum natronophilum TaxID=768733 RepID=UPI00216A18A8|nr:DEAD/DEAH box helicase family protein [Methanosalsum natronophilum]MCS3923608.1 superfamily II DNA or RNA helicase [Methanosalsum natronophilum]